VNVCAPQAPSAGRVEVLYTHCDGILLHGANDIVFDAQGGFWFTDFGKKFADRLMHGAVYYARADGAPTESDKSQGGDGPMSVYCDQGGLTALRAVKYPH